MTSTNATNTLISNTDISTSTLLQRNPDMIAANLDGDLVMMNEKLGRYYGISGVGARAWELLETPASIDDLVNAICQEYDIDTDTCQQDIIRFAQDLMKVDLIEPVNK
ncbi:PqqD family peptide modification chaperone [Vreelandella neptunia]|uniref:PqqD family peptide modification chaperone n=1 Tax=Vreelandella neptunia TaxID=115551 RepID=A0ABS9S775_9GAMM|nr:PqqD family peptide modification chaperone [Halomonas neptunia]MCH4811956.1 PqqD family peptide modification chaperone [Halomonas neptunia]